MNIKGIIAQISILCVVSAIVGITVNAVRPDGIPLVRKHIRDQRGFAAATNKPNRQALFIALDDAKRAYDSGSAVFVDARPIEDFRSLHVNGATSLYYETAGSLWMTALEHTPKGQMIITYCSDPECESAIKLGDTLTAVGFANVYIMLDGLPAWKEAGYPVEAGE